MILIHISSSTLPFKVPMKLIVGVNERHIFSANFAFRNPDDIYGGLPKPRLTFGKKYRLIMRSSI